MASVERILRQEKVRPSLHRLVGTDWGQKDDQK